MCTGLAPTSVAEFRQLYFTLAKETTHSALLDSCNWQGKTGGMYRMAFTPEITLQLKENHLWINGRPTTEINTKETLWQSLAQQFEIASKNNSNPQAGWIGVLGYELNHLLEPSVPQRFAQNPMGELYFIQFRHNIHWHPETQQFEITTPDPNWKDQVEQVLLSSSKPPCHSERHFYPKPSWHLKPSEESASLSPLTHTHHPSKGKTPKLNQSFTPKEFESQVEHLKDQIAQGNLYQANLSIRFESGPHHPDELRTIYEDLVTTNPSPFSGIFWTPEGIILSNSPERLVKYSPVTNTVETRPIAGTRGRGNSETEDTQIGHILETNIKEQAEHMMLLDLERNDLGRIATPGTVKVTELGILERYSHVTHLVSQIEAQKAPDKTAWDILQTMFPGGTITGCPKVRCMDILSSAESVPRGFYTGSLGYIDIDGNMDFNILIRSLFYWPDGKLHFHAGAGIIADSVPAYEYRECLRKTEAIKGVLSDARIAVHP